MKRILFPICILMTILIVVLSMLTFSFSWFAPGSETGVGLQFSETTSVRSENCKYTTYTGDNNNGVISYENVINASTEVTVSSQGSGNNATPGFAYFKTVIQNVNDNYDTNISLYLPQFNVDTETTAAIGVAVPTNTYKSYKGNNSDVAIVRNAYIAAYSYDKDASGSISIEWFVKCDKGAVTLNPGSVYLTYN